MSKQIESEIQRVVSGSPSSRVYRSEYGRLLEVRGPAVRRVRRDGRDVFEQFYDSVKLESPKQSGYAIEGHVRIGGRRYSAFTDGGPDDFVIVVRNFK